MIDWGGIIYTLITTVIIGGGAIFTFFLFFKQRKKKENSDVVDKDASAALNMLEFTNNYQSFTERMIKSYQESLDKKDEIILENQRKLLELESIVAKHSKELKKLSELYLGEQRKKSHAEQWVCFNSDCGLRQPAKGTFKSKEENVNDNI